MGKTWGLSPLVAGRGTLIVEVSHTATDGRYLAKHFANGWRSVGTLFCRLLNAREVFGGVCVSLALVSRDGGVRAKRSRQRYPLSLGLGIGPDLAAGD